MIQGLLKIRQKSVGGTPSRTRKSYAGTSGQPGLKKVKREKAALEIEDSQMVPVVGLGL
jgi:hypothetical protein